MKLATTFCPQKICWELTYVHTQGKNPTNNWFKNKPLIRNSLNDLKKAGITIIRLVIFPEEITLDGRVFSFKKIEYILNLCKKLTIQVDFCIGPYQYPHYPGIRFPKECKKLINTQKVLDSDYDIKQYGLDFLKLQLERYGKDSRVRGFYLGNEWPNIQGIEGMENTQVSISQKFMIFCIQMIKKYTVKPIFLNSSFDASLAWLVKKSYKKIFKILGEQGRLGFDMYPSQGNWKSNILHFLFPYHTMIHSLSRYFRPSVLLFSEIEAQPWGGGRAWYEYIKKEKNPQEKVLQYSNNSLAQTFEKYILPSKIQEVNLWGAEFWLVCRSMNINWPLEQIKRFS